MSNIINMPTSGIPQYKIDLLSYLFTLKINSIENVQRQVGGVYSVQKQIEDLKNQIIFKITQSQYINSIIKIFEGYLASEQEILTITSTKKNKDAVRQYALVISDDYSDFTFSQLDESGEVYVMIKGYGK